jgi:succinate dehydrogenase/fumarate reductase flavoprotein subunit|tara:strand:+ start:5046 stop:7001 length:1956 start_codon:yes stop_codon:yes gene_type:complete
MTIETEWLSYDVIVVGSGGAGAQAASAAAELGASVLLVSKDPLGASDTKISEGLATVRESGSDDDIEEVLSENIKLAGGDLPIKKLTDTFSKYSKEAYDKYREHGLRPSINKAKNRPQSLPLAMGGHNRNRSVGHENHGVAFGHANWDAIIKEKNIDYLEDAWFLDLVVDRNNKSTNPVIIGGLIYDASKGVLLAINSPSVIIASGGLSTLFFPKTDTMRGNTGDSYAIALRAGADLVDMEQLQFLPFCLASPPSYEGLLAGEPSTASYLGVLRDKNGKIILNGVHLRTRAACSEAIMRAVEDGRGSPNGGAFLDMTANKELPKSGPYFMKYLQDSLPTAYINARQALGKEAAKVEVAWEVRPGAHYMMGGIRVNDDGASVGGDDEGSVKHGISGLFAAGQAMGGLFGANRLGSTSLTELAVFGSRAGVAAAKNSLNNSFKVNKKLFESYINEYSSLFGQKGSIASNILRDDIQKESWKKIGPVRTAKGIKEMEDKIKEIETKLNDISIPNYFIWNQAFMDFVELKNMICSAKLIGLAAKERNGSIGGHVRLDAKNISIFSRPYSTVVHKNNNTYLVKKLNRTRTPLKNLIYYKILEKKRLLEARFLSMLPKNIKDKKLEKKYKDIMSASGKAPEIMPGGTEGAIGETTSA